MAGLYLHIPFCKQRCIYCDFYSTTQGAGMDQFVDILCKEMVCRAEYLRGEEVRTIYLGGGTPSLLKEAHFQKLADTWKAHFQIASDAEITLEANPDDVSAVAAQLWHTCSFNRVSLGVQSFQDDTLKRIRRRHSSLQIFHAFGELRKAGFENISMDLIYGLPGEGIDTWKENVEKLMSLRPEHLSAYLLTYEEGTHLYRMRQAGEVVEMQEEDSAACYAFLRKRAQEAGYDPYELSNFALPGFYSRHNTNYWKEVPYLGVGPSAHSYDRESRQWNTSDLDAYLSGWKKDAPSFEKEVLDLSTRYNEYIVTHLRTKWGVSLTELAALFGEERAKYARDNASVWLSGKKMLLHRNVLYLTEEGLFVSDAIMSDLLYV